MVKAGGGSFVGMSSIAGHMTHLWFGAYTVAKAGIEAMMRNAADEFGPVGVRFNSDPPRVHLHRDHGGHPPRLAGVRQLHREHAARRRRRARGRGHLARFLISDEARWITGQEIGVDGGHTLRRGPDFSAFIEPAIGADALRARS